MVCFVDDPNCDIHQSLSDNDHDSPNRTKFIRLCIQKYGLIKNIEQIGSISVHKKDLELCHDPNYIELIFNCCRLNKPTFIVGHNLNTNLSVQNLGSLASILGSIASVFAAVESVCCECKIDTVSIDEIKAKRLKKYKNKIIKKVFCCTRPPGNRAHKNYGMDGCFFNNVALAATYAFKYFPSIIKKILIFDMDLFHGSGTQNIFWSNPNVMYASFHKKNNDLSNVNNNGDETETGEFNNIINFSFTKNDDIKSYMDKFNIFLVKAKSFSPDLVLISAGFNSHKDDIYHELPLNYIDYHIITKKLVEIADTYAKGKLISVLEGGADLNVLAQSVIVHIATLINCPD